MCKITPCSTVLYALPDYIDYRIRTFKSAPCSLDYKCSEFFCRDPCPGLTNIHSNIYGPHQRSSNLWRGGASSFKMTSFPLLLPSPSPSFSMSPYMPCPSPCQRPMVYVCNQFLQCTLQMVDSLNNWLTNRKWTNSGPWSKKKNQTLWLRYFWNILN